MVTAGSDGGECAASRGELFGGKFEKEDDQQVTTRPAWLGQSASKGIQSFINKKSFSGPHWGNLVRQTYKRFAKTMTDFL